MAVDTADKRYSMIAFGKPIPQIFPIPDGSDWSTVAERAAGGLWLYAGLNIQSGQPTMRRWGGVPYVRQGRNFAGRTW